MDRNSIRKEQRLIELENLSSNPRVTHIHIAAPEDCILGQSIQGTYSPGDVPDLPVEGCSRPGGCICAYLPVLTEIFP
jgi:hypothetical protein